MSQLEAKEGYVTAVDELVASKGAAPSSSEAEAGEDDTSSSASSKSSALGPVMSIMANAAAE
ncbi:hypothetical protein PTSG_05685 [Salpingoeca rosetta]|uniref:ACB domain-containing protein n=1 Tax=Salpingoeca rosetta (strain ATCC 50818 / BSB-021) TaxID=946362 RepID=F2UBX4_SALR5|nr:uncharacterized protein PTSG_05685 [Salpingoeca rosetta]EGD73990.1 hypothetical protein PTSG_05685 [Salpingoeca rosetta]|eukprot:XP_004993553.1 hypothetical protein PTSG_05685 [Salpingoeca rosetta]